MPDPFDTEFVGDVPPPPDLQLPGDRYRVLRKLGSGSMGDVYLAVDTKLRRNVAIKSIRADRAHAGQILRRIKRECLLHAQIGAHPHIVTLFDLHDDGEQLHLVMEYVDGDTLDHVLAQYRKQRRHFPVGDSIDIVVQCLRGLAHVHARGIIHRDIKPANVILTRDDTGHYTAKIMDFGVARQEEQDPDITTLTQPGGRSPGTPLYMSPEQIDSVTYGPVTQASDLYSVGVLLYQMISGHPPFIGSLTDVFNGHLNVAPRPIHFAEGTGPHPALVALIDTALQKQAARRYSSATIFANRLEAIRDVALNGEIMEDSEPGSILVNAWQASATRWLAASVAGLAIAGIAFLGLRGLPDYRMREDSDAISAAQSPGGAVDIQPESAAVEVARGEEESGNDGAPEQLSGGDVPDPEPAASVATKPTSPRSREPKSAPPVAELPKAELPATVAAVPTPVTPAVAAPTPEPTLSDTSRTESPPVVSQAPQEPMPTPIVEAPIMDPKVEIAVLDTPAEDASDEAALLEAAMLEAPGEGAVLEPANHSAQIIPPIPGLESVELHDPYALASGTMVEPNAVEIVDAEDANKNFEEPDIPFDEVHAPVVVVASATSPTGEGKVPLTEGQTYTVLPGDSLEVIARRFSLDKALLARWNQIVDTETLRVGQKLYLYERPNLPTSEEWVPEISGAERKESKSKELMRKTRAVIKGLIE